MDTADRSHSTAPSRQADPEHPGAPGDSGAAGGRAADARPRPPAGSRPASSASRTPPPRRWNWRAAAPTASARSSPPTKAMLQVMARAYVGMMAQPARPAISIFRSRRRHAVGQRHVDRRRRRQASSARPLRPRSASTCRTDRISGRRMETREFVVSNYIDRPPDARPILIAAYPTQAIDPSVERAVVDVDRPAMGRRPDRPRSSGGRDRACC